MQKPCAFVDGSGAYRIRWNQDSEVLRNTYKDLQKVNPGLKRNASLEEIVQSSETCNIYKHEHHRDVEENIKKQKGWKAFSYVISCTSTDKGCRRGPNHSAGIPDDPLKVDLRFTASGETGHHFWQNKAFNRDPIEGGLNKLFTYR